MPWYVGMVSMPVILAPGKGKQEIAANLRTKQPKKKTVLSKNQLAWSSGEQGLQRKETWPWLEYRKGLFQLLFIPVLLFLAYFPPVPMKGSLSDLSVQSMSNRGSFLQRAKGALLSITAGQKVISKHKNGRFYQCEVVRLTTETFYEVNFDDGSFSDNLYPEDIVVMSASSFWEQLGIRMSQCCWMPDCGPTPLSFQTERSIHSGVPFQGRV